MTTPVTFQASESLLLVADPLPPSRGLVAAQSFRGEAYDLTDIKRWVTLNGESLKTERVDVLLSGGRHDAVIMPLIEHAQHTDVVLSVRTDCAGDTAIVERWRDAGLHDLCLAPRSLDRLRLWADAARSAAVPFRVHWSASWEDPRLLSALPEHVAGATTVSLGYYDPLAGETARLQESAALERMGDMLRLFADAGIDASLHHVPFCQLPGDQHGQVRNSQQLTLDHLHYRPASLGFALQVLNLPPARISKVIEVFLNRYNSFHNRIDQALLPWVYQHPRIYFRIWLLHKLTRHFNWLRHRPTPLPEGTSPEQQGAQRERIEARKTLTPECARCALQSVCDHPTEPFRTAFPQAAIKAVPGEVELDPLFAMRGQPRPLDALDLRRMSEREAGKALAEEALRLTTDRPPTREISSDSYEIEGQHTQHMPGSVRWWSFAPAELQSTPLGRFEAPITLGLTFGGGFAKLIGFSFGRTAKILCPMIRPRHRLLLHVAADGHYVLLRDDVPVPPIELEEAHVVPRRLAPVIEPRISIWNIDGQILTQTLLLWEHQEEARPSRPRYSVIVVSSRYARRLQAVLLAIAHQREVPLDLIEVVVAYVPGLDPTDDLLDSLRFAHPHLRVVRSPFPAGLARSKGLMINESFKRSSGEWIILLDSDILLPPDFFAQLDQHRDSAHFAAPDGRLMLSPETTARVLLGEEKPWEHYESLAASAAEYRHHESDGVPPGFCQCVKREILEANPYSELDHFEGSDWLFSKQIQDRFGREVRLEGMKVLHLDHGGSQWFGTAKQM